MGYWSYHPMGGDSPLDDKGYLMEAIIKFANRNRIISPDEVRMLQLIENLNEDKINAELIDSIKKTPFNKLTYIDTKNIKTIDFAKTFDKYLTLILKKIVHDEETLNFFFRSYKRIKKDFVFVYMIIEHEIKIKNEKVSSLVIDMLGDGGNKKRHYSPETRSVEEILKFFEVEPLIKITPESYAKVLKFYWKDLMKGKITFKEFDNKFKCKGLLETIHETIKNDQVGLINVN
jgi:hypothetical protein